MLPNKSVTYMLPIVHGEKALSRGRKLGLMREVARDNLSALTDLAIAALYSYLHALPPP